MVSSWQQGKEKSWGLEEKAEGLKVRRRDLVTVLRRNVRKRLISFPVCVAQLWCETRGGSVLFGFHASPIQGGGRIERGKKGKTERNKKQKGEKTAER